LITTSAGRCGAPVPSTSDASRITVVAMSQA